MCDWMAVSADLLAPIVKLMLSRILTSKVVQNDDELPKVLPKSPIGEAIQYTLNHWVALSAPWKQGLSNWNSARANARSNPWQSVARTGHSQEATTAARRRLF